MPLQYSSLPLTTNMKQGESYVQQGTRLLLLLLLSFTQIHRFVADGFQPLSSKLCGYSGSNQTLGLALHGL